MQKYDSAPIMSILPIGYGNRMDAIGAPGWNCTTGVSYVTDLQSAALAARHTDAYNAV